MILIKKYILCLFLLSPLIMSARILEINSRSRLFNRINSSYIAVVQFFCSKDYSCKNDAKTDFKELKERLSSVSMNSRYRYAKIDFIAIDCGSDCSVCDAFNLQSLPMLMLFKDGQPIPGAQLPGFVREYDINNFINSYLNQQIDDVVEDREKERERQQELQALAWTAWAPYWYGGYGRPWGFGGCGWGMYGGCGLGRGCCW